MIGKNTKAHLALLAAGSIWGLMSPIGKAAMNAGFSALALTSLRMIGAAILFWVFSLFAPKERVSKRDFVLLFFAGLLGVVFNQGMFTTGLSLTSPVDATVITTSLPLITMVLAALFLKEPATPKKIIGVLTGAVGALVLILSNYGKSDTPGSILGDLMCLTAQISFACYLTLFKGLIARYHIFTLMKWMFTYATLCFLPFAFTELQAMANAQFPLVVWLQAGYVVVFGTFIAYLLMLFGQKRLRPTVVSMYNYIQPIVGATATVWMGIEGFGWAKTIASLLIFTGVYLVTRSKSREQMLNSKERHGDITDKKGN